MSRMIITVGSLESSRDFMNNLIMLYHALGFIRYMLETTDHAQRLLKYRLVIRNLTKNFP
uniref:Uncharacterized protein n=1 Tax=Arundo donax TaxID=35708 RepID=A0A0A8YB29_ARUDO